MPNAVSAVPTRLFSEEDLGHIYRAVGQRAAAFSGRHGPLEMTAWIHLSAAELEQLDDAVTCCSASGGPGRPRG